MGLRAALADLSEGSADDPPEVEVTGIAAADLMLSKDDGGNTSSHAGLQQLWASVVAIVVFQLLVARRLRHPLTEGRSASGPTRAIFGTATPAAHLGFRRECLRGLFAPPRGTATDDTARVDHVCR
jgi:hypothetical protein